MMECPNCGKEVPERRTVCPYCDYDYETERRQRPASKTTTDGANVNIEDSVVTGGIGSGVLDDDSGGSRVGVKLKDSVVTGGVHIRQLENIVHCAISGTAINVKETFRCEQCGRIVWHRYLDIESGWCTECAALAAERSQSLFILDGDGTGAEYRLNKRVTKLGRDRGNDIVLGADREISRFHAEIKRTGEAYTLVDMISRFGTYVNGVKIREKELRAGDRIRIGQTTLGFDTDESPNTIARPGGDMDVAQNRRAVGDGRKKQPTSTSLVVVKGDRAGREHILDDRSGNELFIGRERRCAIHTGKDPHVSRRHAKLIIGRDGGVAVVDLGSTNGTYVNGERLEADEPRELRPNDNVRVGKTLFRLR